MKLMRFSAASLLILGFLSAASVNASDLVVCLKEAPHWAEISGGQLGAQARGPAVIINTQAKRVTWIGTGGYINLTGERNAQGVKIVRIDGRASQEPITAEKRTGRVLDLELADSLGGQGLLRISMQGNSGRASWQHATDSSSEELDFCTTNVLN